MNIERLSLDQLRVFALIADNGSFSAAARRLGRAQSAVSYAVTTLEQQLGVALFDRSGYRPRLTAAGSALLQDARVILERSDRLQARAKAMAAGLESELGLAVDVMFPTGLLIGTLQAFQREFPAVNLRLFVDALGAVAEKVLDDVCQIGIIATLPRSSTALTGFALPPVTLVPVAAPQHALVQRRSEVSELDLRDQLQLVLTDRSRLTEGRDYAVFGSRTWRLGDLATKHQLLLAGLGWGFMPLHMATADLAEGRLQRLRIESRLDGGHRLPMHCLYRADRPQGPAASWILKTLRALSGYDSEVGPAAET